MKITSTESCSLLEEYAVIFQFWFLVFVLKETPVKKAVQIRIVVQLCAVLIKQFQEHNGIALRTNF